MKKNFLVNFENTIQVINIAINALKFMDSSKWDILIKDCFLQNYVLVIGNDIMLETEKCGETNLDNYLWSEYISATRNKKIEFKDFLMKVDVPLENCNKRLLELLKLKLFRVVITTTVNDLLEKMMREVWGDKLQIVDFCNTEMRNVFKADSNGEFDFTRPTLCYAFGKAGNSNKFGYDEDNQLEVIANWYNPTLDRYPEDFYRYIQTKKLLAIGCKLDNWLFRFFWYSLRRNVLTIKSDKYVGATDSYRKGAVAIELNDKDSGDENLKEYLERKELFIFDNVNLFIEDFLSQLEFKEDGICIYKNIEVNSEYKECFISYAHEDFDIAYKLFLILKRRGFSVWIDTQKLLPGSLYEQRINKAIEQCEVFLPILSDTISKDYRNGEFDIKENEGRRYYLNEWERVMKCSKEKVIIPVLCKDFDVKDDSYKHTFWYKEKMDRTFYKIDDPFNLLIDGIRENGYDIKSSKTEK